MPGTMSRPERQVAGPSPLLRTHTNRSTRRVLAGPLLSDEPPMQTWEAWALFSKAMTCCIPAACMSCCNVKGKGPQQAWREKVTLCILFALLSLLVLFFIVGLNPVLCPASDRVEFAPMTAPGTLVIHGRIYSLEGANNDIAREFRDANGQDASDFFSQPELPVCAGLDVQRFPFASTSIGPLCQATQSCFDVASLKLVTSLADGSTVDPTAAYDWTHLQNQNYIVYKEMVLNLEPFYRVAPIPRNPVDKLLRYLRAARILDASRPLVLSDELGSSLAARQCLEQKFFAGRVAEQSVRCIFAFLFSLVIAIIVLGVMMARFVMAVLFDWFFSRTLARTPDDPVLAASAATTGAARKGSNPQSVPLSGRPYDTEMAKVGKLKTKPSMDVATIGLDLYTILLVTCYSEGEASLRTTMESLAATDYNDRRKLLFVIADGIITGKGNDKSTPDLLLDMIEIDQTFGSDPKPYSYIAVASGSKGHNMARVYVGHFRSGDHRVPTILVIKCGTPEEASEAKPGNRGKRDSQLILMNFFTRVMLNDRMTPLDFDMFRKVHHIMGVTPDFFEIVLMVDADTKIATDSLRLMINAMHNDQAIMGLCGETRIANKTDSWVTTIQVFEYYISHHLGKAFESVFGGVTCLPGCFCMYRIKSRKENGDWVPILANPDVVETYSTNEVDTLHQKNLLLLGEDRFLTTMMLRTFPVRKMVFIPQAVCKTVVPDDFATLLSQRRRWINSTIHNLAELVMVNNLCGTFCFSMQFVVLLDLISTAVLPVTILAAIYIILDVVLRIGAEGLSTGQYYTIGTLGLVMFFPSMIVILSFRRYQYVLWLFVYLLALPIWNMVLPLYAFWHFDDFSWGATRQLAGQKKQGGGDDHGDSSGTFDGTKVSLKRWEEYERAWRKRRQQANATTAFQQQRGMGGSSLSDMLPGKTATSTTVYQPRPALPESLPSFDFSGTAASSIHSQDSDHYYSPHTHNSSVTKLVSRPDSPFRPPGAHHPHTFQIPSRTSSHDSLVPQYYHAQALPRQQQQPHRHPSTDSLDSASGSTAYNTSRASSRQSLLPGHPRQQQQRHQHYPDQ
ncbi:chitin synthase-domain-containing protein [Powellomyces hirtus]|nr:chitin synthase-domain-containing protein [Powellomyces hirtus]